MFSLSEGMFDFGHCPCPPPHPPTQPPAPNSGNSVPFLKPQKYWFKRHFKVEITKDKWPTSKTVFTHQKCSCSNRANIFDHAPLFQAMPERKHFFQGVFPRTHKRIFHFRHDGSPGDNDRGSLLQVISCQIGAIYIESRNKCDTLQSIIKSS